MATRIPAPRHVGMDPVEVSINGCFDELVVAVNKRREELLSEYKGRRDYIKAGETGMVKTKQQLIESKDKIEEIMADNLLHSLRRRMSEDIDKKIRDLEVTGSKLDLTFQFDIKDLGRKIAKVGQLIQGSLPIPKYSTITEPRISLCEAEPGQIQSSINNGVAYCEASRLIYVTETSLLLGRGRVLLFNDKGKKLNSFGEQCLILPVGVAILGNSVYVSDCMHKAIFHFILPEYKLVSKRGCEDIQFIAPQYLSVAANGDVYVADSEKNRVVVMNSKLRFKHSIEHPTMTKPYDVKVLDEKVYVLSPEDSPCLHVFTVSGSKVGAIIDKKKKGEYKLRGSCFCFDQQKNILIGHQAAGNIKIFSPTGSLLHTIGDTVEDAKKINPTGIVVTNENKIVCSSDNTMFGLHVFY